MKKTIFTIILLLAALFLAVKIRNFLKTFQPVVVTPEEGGAVICTMDAMMCPDGSYVGRSGPMCEFKCPELSTDLPVATTTRIIGLGESFTIASTTMTALTVTEDSRCPSDVTCIQAGRVGVALNIVSPMGSSTRQIEPGKTITTETLAITLDDVRPYPVSVHKTEDEEYRFSFSIISHTPPETK